MMNVSSPLQRLSAISTAKNVSLTTPVQLVDVFNASQFSSSEIADYAVQNWEQRAFEFWLLLVNQQNSLNSSPVAELI